MDAGGEITVTVKQRDGKVMELRTDAILVATGRKPTVKGIGLEAAGIDYDERTGVKVLSARAYRCRLCRFLWSRFAVIGMHHCHDGWLACAAAHLAAV